MSEDRLERYLGQHAKIKDVHAAERAAKAREDSAASRQLAQEFVKSLKKRGIGRTALYLETHEKQKAGVVRRYVKDVYAYKLLGFGWVAMKGDSDGYGSPLLVLEDSRTYECRVPSERSENAKLEHQPYVTTYAPLKEAMSPFADEAAALEMFAQAIEHRGRPY